MPSPMPIYRFCAGPPQFWNPGELNYTPGRIGIPLAHHREPYRGEFLEVMGGEEGLEKYLGPNDILCVRLYKGCIDNPAELPKYPAEKVFEFDRLCELIKGFGPRIKGILVGNQGGETSYRHECGSWKGNAAKNITQCTEFVKEVGALIRDLGAVPFFSLMDWELIQDAYQTGWILRDALEEVGATNYCGCAYSCVSNTYKHGPMTNQLKRLSEFEGRGFKVAAPGDKFPGFIEYIKSYPKHWTGLGGKKGIEAGNVDLMAEAGFTAGVVSLNGKSITELDSSNPGWRDY